MDFSMQFVPITDIIYSFVGESYAPIDLHEDKPVPVLAKINSNEDDAAIGELTGFLLYNEADFFSRCDCVSGDCAVIAETVCKRDGSVSARYISKNHSYDQVFIWDRIHIEKQYLNRGIASTVIKNLPAILTYQFGNAGSTILLCASDYTSAEEYGFDSEEYRVGTERLKRFYHDLGYRNVKNNVMLWKNKAERRLSHSQRHHADS